MYLVLIFILTTVIHTVETSAHAARLAGVRTGRLNLARSLYNVLALGARGATALSALLLGNLTDVAVATGETATLINSYRWVLAGAALGTLVAALLIPTLSRVIARGVLSYEMRRSLPEVVVRATSVQGLWKLRADWMPPRVATLGKSRRQGVPKRLLVASMVENL